MLCGALIIFMVSRVRPATHALQAKKKQIPGLGYLYSGLTRRKNALTLLFMSMIALAITSFQWMFIGYSLVFSETGGVFLGDGR